MQKSLTIFTPTFNRAYILPELYNDLLNQTNKDFTWLVIDDGSHDNTEELAQKWKKDSKINIEFFKQANGGKYTAINKSLELCSTGYYAIIDSDDRVTKNFVQVFFNNVDIANNSDQLLGICTPKHYSNSKHTCETYPKQNQSLFYNELKQKYNYHGETTVVLKMDIIKDFRFPVFPKEKFMSEVLIGNEFFYKYRFLSINNHISSSTYLNDGLTFNMMSLVYKNPYATACVFKSYAHFKLKDGGSNSLIRHIKFHAWVSAFKLDQSKIPQWPLKGFCNLIGKIASPITKLIYKQRNEKFKNGVTNI